MRYNLIDHMSLLNKEENFESLEVWIYALTCTYNEKTDSWNITQNIWKEEDFFHFSEKRERLISNDNYGKTYELKPNYHCLKGEHTIVIPCAAELTTQMVHKSQHAAIKKLIKIIEGKNEKDIPVKRRLLRNLNLLL